MLVLGEGLLPLPEQCGQKALAGVLALGHRGELIENLGLTDLRIRIGKNWDGHNLRDLFSGEPLPWSSRFMLVDARFCPAGKEEAVNNGTHG